MPEVGGPENVAHVIQVALTPVFLLEVAIALGALAGAATGGATFTLFIGGLRDAVVGSTLFVLFGCAVICIILTGVGGLLNVFNARLTRIAGRADSAAELLRNSTDKSEPARIEAQFAQLARRIFVPGARGVSDGNDSRLARTCPSS
jgi:hypothetical protein